MRESLADTLRETAGVLRWFHQYEVSNALILLARLLRARQVTTLDDLERLVVAEEEDSAKGAGT